MWTAAAIRRIVSSHAPVKGATDGLYLQLTALEQCFKSCPREGGNSSVRWRSSASSSVSSHAPVKGATRLSFFAWALANSFKSCPREGGNQGGPGESPTRPLPVSSHAPVKGATSRLPPKLRLRSFKSCPREGGNVPEGLKFLKAGEVSSHAPVKGATALWLG